MSASVQCLSCGEHLQRNVTGQTTRFYVYRRLSDNAAVTLCPNCNARLDIDTTQESRHVQTDIPLVDGYKRAKTTKCYWPRVKAQQAARRGWFRVWLARLGYALFCGACIGMLLWVAFLLAFTSTAGTGVFTH